MDIEALLKSAKRLAKKVPPDELRHVVDVSDDCKFFTYPFEYQTFEQEPDRVLFDDVSNGIRRRLSKRRSDKKTMKKEFKGRSSRLLLGGAVGAMALLLTWWTQ